jgi:hypothetical protein
MKKLREIIPLNKKERRKEKFKKRADAYLAKNQSRADDYASARIAMSR